jgi:D-sedoheptulose 7-phosphate isomerase
MQYLSGIEEYIERLSPVLIEEYIEKLSSVLNNMDLAQIERFVQILNDARDNDKFIYVFGNGGSGSAASHLVSDLNKGCAYSREKRFKVICLNDNMPVIAAYANDVSYDDVFCEQLRNYLKPEDIVIGISGSGNSLNILKAIEYANSINAFTIGVCGFDGGKLKHIAKHAVHINIDDMQITEDIEVVINHILMKVLMQ